MTDGVGYACAFAVVVLALAASATEAIVPDGDPLLSEVPDRSWRLTGPVTMALEVAGDARLAATGCPDQDCRGSVARTVQLPTAGTWMVRAEIERVTPGRGARVFLSTLEPRWSAGVGPGEVGRRVVVQAVSVGVPAGPAEVGVVVRGDEVVRVGQVSVLRGRTSAAHAAFRWAAVAAGVVGAAVVLTRVGRAVGAWPVLALGAAVLVGVMAPRDQLDAALLLLPGTTPADLQGSLFHHPTPLVLLQKLGGHGVGFALLGALGRLWRVPPSTLAARLLSFAAATEAIQLLLPDRSGRLSDVAIDVCGGLLGAAVAEIILRAGALRAPRASAASRP